MAKKRFVFVIDEERDQEVLFWWGSRENKSAAVRDLIRKDIDQDSVTLQDIYRAVTDLEQRMGSGQVSFNGNSEPDLVQDEPADVVAAPEGLGL